MSVTLSRDIGNAFSWRALPWQARARVAVRKSQHFLALLSQTCIPTVERYARGSSSWSIPKIKQQQILRKRITRNITTREASPSRYGANRAGGIGSRRPPATPHLTERILRQSREAESALADALVSVHLHLRYLDVCNYLVDQLLQLKKIT